VDINKYNQGKVLKAERAMLSLQNLRISKEISGSDNHCVIIPWVLKLTVAHLGSMGTRKLSNT